MSIAPYIHAKGFLIGNTYYGEFAAAADHDTLIIDGTDPDRITFEYQLKAGGVDHKVYSWATAEGKYYEDYDCIFGKLKVFEAYTAGSPISYADATFSIARDRTLPPDGIPRIHVYVVAGSGAPDEGSYTGDGK
jgi:hypothetical protein